MRTPRAFSGDVSNCPGYFLTGLSEFVHGLSAHHQLAGQGCNAFGVDIKNLTIETPWAMSTSTTPNRPNSQNPSFSSLNPPSQSFKTTSDLTFNYNSQPFAFWITRRDGTGEPLFDTRASSLPPTPIPAQDPSTDNSTSFDNQYLQLASALPYDAIVYGLGEVIASSSGLRRDVGTNGEPGTIQTLWARDVVDPIDENISNGVDILLQTSQSQGTSSPKSLIEYHFLGGTFDFCFLSGPIPQAVASQYSEIVGSLLWTSYRAFGFRLCRNVERFLSRLS
ncbi:hypothetical protein Clacol_003194 [Clathrus columnatus]|uniref:Uncharacterized protein n=1 Tax=Clathrus columnatus TaxID=1419009 RepID=A0AAV5A669_9AGAM|nr:hypothetical protein Clacol_003194 [Clathrus columnatus]